MLTYIQLSIWLIVALVDLCKGIALHRLNKNVSNYPFDKKLYENVLDPELCQRQLGYLTENNNLLMLRFRDASAQIPRGMLLGNTLDLGNYHQCLKINEDVEDMNIQGKYCMTGISMNQNIQMPNFPLPEWSIFERNAIIIDRKIMNGTNNFFEKNVHPIFGIHNLNTRIGPGNPLSNTGLRLAFCVPASCTSEEAVNAFYFNVTATGTNFNEDFCRLPNDKPWVPADYVALVIFSTIGLLVILSTSYDFWQSFMVEKDPKNISTVYISFSAYTNTKRLLTFKSGPDSLHCIDGIRAIAMIWVVVGHTIMSLAYSVNPLDGFQWLLSRSAIWITAAPITVDTFFMLSGLLVVYTTVGKLNNMQLLKNIHLYYLNRLLRMFPILAAVILYETSLHNRVFDGPNWNTPAMAVLTCRQYWWTALLHIQNLYNPHNMCLAVSWYLSVDVQLHILSPIVLYWVLSRRKHIAWIGLTAGLLTSLVAATIYNFMNNFQSGSFSMNAIETERYFIYYYINTLTRASPFFVGMAIGYILHVWKGKSLRLNKLILLVVWVCDLLLLAGVIYCVRLNLEDGWDNQLADNFLNSFLRPAWAMGLGWLIFACVKGYGGPINWFLSLNMWKLPARLSYAIYLIHLTIIISTYSSSSVQIYFSISKFLFDVLAFLFITTIVAFIITVTIDAPFAILLKLLLPKDKLSQKLQTTNTTNTINKAVTQHKKNDHSRINEQNDEIR